MQSPSSEEVVQAISDKIKALLPDWYDEQTKLDSSWPKIERKRYSFMLHFPVRSSNQDVFYLIVKIDSHPELESIQDAVRATKLYISHQKEFCSMKDIEEKINNANLDGLTAVRMLAYFPEWNAIVMEKFQGIVLRDFFLSKMMLFGSQYISLVLEKAIHQVGIWLRIFHDEVGEKKLQPFIVDEWLNEVQSEIKLIRFRIEKHVNVDLLYQTFESAAKKLSGEIVGYATQHGDFQMNNILIGEDGSIACIDPNTPKHGLIFQDLARLIIEPITLKLQILTMGMAINRKQLALLKKSLLSGYFGEDEYNQNFIALCSAFALLKKWRDDELRLEKLKLNQLIDHYFVSAYIRYYFLRNINKELSSIILI